MLLIREHPEGIIFKIFVQPRSSRNQIVGVHGDALKVKVTAPPVGGAANRMCLNYLAKCLGSPPFLFEIVTGHNSRTKQVLLRSEHLPASEKEKQRLKVCVQNLIDY